MPTSTPGGGSRRYTCPYCNRESDGTALACPACGAPVDVQAVAAPSGWVELPAIRDMARIEFGRSSCQIEGLYVPVADFNLAPGDGVYFTHHVVLWKDPGVPITLMPLAGGWKRMFAGLPIVMTQAHGPGHIAFSRDAPGEMVALPLQPGETVDVREHVFVAATSQVQYDFFSTDIYFTTRRGDESETHYPVGYLMDRFRAESPGLVLIHGSGNVFERRLGPDEMILVKPTALLFKDTSVAMQLHTERPLPVDPRTGRTALYFDRYLWVRLFGPGRVAIQSAFEHLEDRIQLQSSSLATDHQPLMRGGVAGAPGRFSYAVDGETKGPVRVDQLQGLIDVGRLPADVPVWSEGMKDWAPASQVAQGLRPGGVPSLGQLYQMVSQAAGGQRVVTVSRGSSKGATCVLGLVFLLFIAVPTLSVLRGFYTSWSEKRRVESEVLALRKACDAGVAERCYSLSSNYQQGRGVSRDAGQAASLLDRSCKGGYLKGCLALATVYEKGDGVPRDAAKALAAAGRACDGGDGPSCLKAAKRYDEADGVPKDPARAIRLFRAACDAGIARACVNAGFRIERGKGAFGDERTVVALYRKGCDGGAPMGCCNLGVMLQDGRGAPRDEAGARELYRKACTGGEPLGCNNLAIVYEQGIGGPRDPGQAEALYRAACDKPDPQGCYDLGMFYSEGRGGAKDSARAAPLLQKACKDGWQPACAAVQKRS